MNGKSIDVSRVRKLGVLPETHFSVLFRCVDTTLLDAYGESIGAGKLSDDARLIVTMLNPVTEPLDAGYLISGAAIQRLAGSDGLAEFRMYVSASVTDPCQLAEEVTERYSLLWGTSEGEMSVARQLYELLVASNANPSPAEIGLELISWREEATAGGGEECKLPESPYQIMTRLHAAVLIRRGDLQQDSLFGSDLAGYAARAAARELLTSWCQALSEGNTGHLLADVDDVIQVLTSFKEQAKGILSYGGAVRLDGSAVDVSSSLAADGPDYTVTAVMSVTAQSVEQAGMFAIDDLRDEAMELDLSVRNDASGRVHRIRVCPDNAA